jgi:hypothetical protein
VKPVQGPLANMLTTLRDAIDRLQSIIHGVPSGPYPGMHIMVFPGPDMMQRLFESGAFTWTGYYLAPTPDRKDRSWVGMRSLLVNQGWGLAPVYLGQQQHFQTVVVDWYDPALHPEGPVAAAEAQAETDAAQAVRLMEDEGFPSGSVVFFDVEDEGAAGTPGYFAYVNHWLAHLPNIVSAGGSSYAPGIYIGQNHANLASFRIPAAAPIWYVRVSNSCSAVVQEVPPGSGHKVITRYAVQAQVLDADGWSILQDPDQHAPCQMWQWGANVILSVDHTGFLLKDYDSAEYRLPTDRFGGLDYDTSWVPDPSVRGGGDTLINYVKSVAQQPAPADVVGGDDVRLLIRLAKPAAAPMGVDVVIHWGTTRNVPGYVPEGQTETVVTVPTDPVQAPTSTRFVAETAWWRYSRADDNRGGRPDPTVADTVVTITPRQPPPVPGPLHTLTTDTPSPPDTPSSPADRTPATERRGSTKKT